MRAKGLAQLILLCSMVAFEGSARAGAPYVTDDPEPVAPGHWELYLVAEATWAQGGATGTLPQVEVNLGAAPNLQLHLVAPMAFDARPGHFSEGLGDVELGAKLRVAKQSPKHPAVASFPLVELPTGSSKRGLGTGHAQVYLPVWIEEDFDPWTSYGGGGRWFTPGTGHAGWWFLGWVLERKLGERVNLGAEVYFESAKDSNTPAAVHLDLGAQLDLSPHHHLLFSMGRSLIGEVDFHDYVGYLLTL